jgi:hypothetical protein
MQGRIKMIWLMVAAACAFQSCAPANNGATDEAAGVGRSPFMPVRISREFFENNVTASVSLSDAAGNVRFNETSATSFQVGEPSGPAPGPDALADYRDRPGCSQMQSSALEGVSVCFVVVPDVSSVDVSGDKVSIQGSDRLLSHAGCAPGTRLDFQKATRSAAGVSMQYTASCEQPVLLQISLSTL